jgi:glucosamine-6-phosphate deaminase
MKRRTIRFGKAEVALYDSTEELMADAAEELFRTLIEKPKAVLALPTGATFEPFYAYVASNYKERGVSFKDAVAFNIDEYVGLPAGDPESYHTYMRKNLYDKVDMRMENALLPDGNARDLDEETRRYENAIMSQGGIDLEYLGIGVNGHIGFNEPGTPFSSRTHVVELAASTQKANSMYFLGRHTPKRAITLGIGTLMEARRVILMATGERKRDIIGRMLKSGKTERIPASALADNGNAKILIDSGATPPGL